jgi:hypothetical protein
MSEHAPTSGFFSALFDFSFTSFVTSSIIRVLYVLATIGLGLLAGVVLVGGLMAGGIQALFAFLWAPLMFLLGLIYVRILLELVIVVFRIGENVAFLARTGGDAETPLSEPPRPVP